MFEKIFWLTLKCLIGTYDTQPTISLKQLTHVMGYHQAKKLKHVKLNGTAFSYAVAVDTVLPTDIQHMIHEQLNMEAVLAKAYIRSYTLLNRDMYTQWTHASQLDKIPYHHVQQPETLALNVHNFHYRPGLWFKECSVQYKDNPPFVLPVPTNPLLICLCLRDTQHLKFDEQQNILYSHAKQTRFFIDVHEIISWKPQCNLQTMQKEASTVQWVVLRTLQGL